MALEELIANKLKCLIQRRHSFDLYDLVYATFFNRSININRGQVLTTFLRKTIFERSPGAAKGILLGLPMAFFKGAWDKYVSPVTSRLDFDRAIEGFNSSIEEIFQGVSPELWGHQPFYPAKYRNLILEAGSARKVMTILRWSCPGDRTLLAVIQAASKQTCLRILLCMGPDGGTQQWPRNQNLLP
jgi:hypothetical protein